MKINKLLFVLSVSATAAFAQEKPSFSLEGEFRPRTEWLGHGQSSSAVTGSKGYVSTSVRSTLAATYKTENYTLYTSVQDVFKMGDRDQIAIAGNGNFRVQEAWADIKLAKNTSFKIGRQPLNYDDQRILGGLDWAQQARTHDAGIFKYSKNGYSLDLGGALNTPTAAIYTTDTNFSYREMGFVRANKKYKDLNVTFLSLVNTFQKTTPNKSTLFTTGLHADYKLGIAQLKSNVYIQNGLRSGDIEVDNAYLASLDATVTASKKLDILAGAEIISGKESATSRGFFPLFGTNHAFNGLMDRFYVGNHANAGGLVDINLGASAKIAGYAVTLKGHSFTEESDGKDNLGSEVDLVVAKQFKGYKLVGGYSQFFEPNTVVNAKDTQNWAWLMLVIKPKFL